MAKTLTPKTPPTLAIDVNDRFAWMRLIVALAWGGEPRKMDRALAALASEGLGVLFELNKRPPRAAPDLPALGRLLDLRVDELARMPGAPTFYRSYFTDPARSASAADARTCSFRSATTGRSPMRRSWTVWSRTLSARSAGAPTSPACC